MIEINNIFFYLKGFLEKNLIELFLSNPNLLESQIKNYLSLQFKNKYSFEIEIISLDDKLFEEYIQVMGGLNLLLVELLSTEIETKMKYFAVVFPDEEGLKYSTNNKPVLDFFFSETIDENKAVLCKIHDTEKPYFDRYNIEMDNTAEGFIEKVADCMQSIEFVKDSHSTIDENSIEHKYRGTGFAYVYDRYVIESVELTTK